MKLEDMVRAARAAGATVDVHLAKEMPISFPNDPEPVRLLIAESKRTSALGNDWLRATVPNQIAAEQLLRMGWAYSLAAVWLRCKMAGELLSESEMKQQKCQLEEELKSLQERLRDPLPPGSKLAIKLQIKSVQARLDLLEKNKVAGI